MTVEFTTAKGAFALCKVLNEPNSSFATRFDYSIIGLTTELTEEQWEEVVDSKLDEITEDTYYPDYTDFYPKGFISPKDSGESLLTSLKVYEKNPYGEKPNEYNEVKGSKIAVSVYEPNEEYSKWQSFESRTGSWLLLKKIW